MRLGFQSDKEIEYLVKGEKEIKKRVSYFPSEKKRQKG